jgi:hypothetical protein
MNILRLTFFPAAIFLLTIIHPAVAQKLSVTEDKAKTEEGISVDVWMAHLDLDVDAAEESFSDFMESTFKYETHKLTKGIYWIEKSKFPDIINLRMDVRAIFQSEPGGRTVSFAFSPGYDVFLGHDTYTDQFQLAQHFVKSYVRFHYKNWYANQVKSFNEKIRSNESDIKSENSKIDKLRGNIADNEAKIKAGDLEPQKLRDKNTKYYKEIDERTNTISSLQRDNANYLNEITKANDSIKIVEEFK